MPRQRNLILLVILTILFNLALIGCGQKSSPPQKPQTDTAGQKPKAPKSAETILKDINKLIGELDKQNKTAKAPWMSGASSGGQGGQLKGAGDQGGSGPGQTGDSSQGGKQGANSGSGSSSGGSASSNTGSTGAGGSQSLSPEEQKKLQWQKIGLSLMDIHKKWNELEPDAIAAGLPNSSLAGFEEALTKLTQSVGAQNTDESLKAAIDLYDQYTAGISQVFTLSTPPELYQVQYRTMAALAAANGQDWSAASDSIEAALEPWGLLKAQAKKADQKLLGRCDYSLQDLKTAINAKDYNMVLIKGDIAQGNLKQLEKSLTSGGQGQ